MPKAKPKAFLRLPLLLVLTLSLLPGCVLCVNQGLEVSSENEVPHPVGYLMTLEPGSEKDCQSGDE